RRVYSIEDVEKLKLLSEASESGYSIGTIAHYNIDELKRIIGKSNIPQKAEKPASTENYLIEDKDYLENCIDSIKTLNPRKLEKELYKALVDLPQPRFIEEIITPLLEKIGNMWKDGDIRILNEHISTAIIRKILTSLIDNNSVSTNAPSILIATPKGQLHELGALIVGVIASSDGWNVTYMGPDLPGEEIAAAIEKLHPKVVALSIIYPSDDYILDKEMLKLKRLLNNGSKIIAGGRSVMTYKSTLDSMNAKIINSIDEFRAELEISRN
ncbi:MAG: cobalamin B12-binding domain-containing protein, partial [Ignavibacteriae bacterium]|nr:cobalamin B12-binding domain-containing protein [Ignavibacteriota bacterium]